MAETVNQVALAWLNTRTALQTRLNSNLSVAGDEHKNAEFNRKFIAAHNDLTRRFIAATGIVDPTLMGALSELAANSPRLMQGG